MIVFDLKCAPVGHVFEAWFASSAAFEEQKGRGLVACPLCGSDDVGKAPMAPAVGAKGNASPAAASAEGLFSGAPAEVKTMLAAAAALQKTLLAGSESVGPPPPPRPGRSISARRITARSTAKRLAPRPRA